MLFVYDFEFNLLFAENRIIKSRWVIYYNNVGTVEVHIPVSSELTKIVSETPYLVIKEKGMAAIVVGREIRDELVLYGRTCNWLLTKRITDEVSEATCFAGEMAAKMASDAFYDVKNFCIGSTFKGDEILFEKKEGKTLDAVRECLECSGLGHELVFDEKDKVWRFDILKGGESDLILSEAHKNVYDMGIYSDILDLATVGRCNLEKEGGYERTEIVSNPLMTGIYRWETELSASGEAEAAAELEKCCEKNKISMDVCDVICGKDYALGDSVRFQVIKGAYRKTERKRLYGVEVCLENGVYRQKPIF